MRMHYLCPMKKAVLSIALLCILSPVLVQAGGIKNAFAALSVYDYFKAREIFTKSLKSKSDYPIAAYGLSVLAARTDNHFYNLDTAYTYILKAQQTYPAATPKQKLNWKLYGADSLSIAQLKDSIEYKEYLIVANRNTMEGYMHYLSMYTISTKIPKVIELRDLLAFNIAGKENTYQSYKNFMDTYPKAVEFDEAKKRYEIVLFSNTHCGT